MNNKALKKAKEDLCFFNEGDYITRDMNNSKEILIKYIKNLEISNRILKKKYNDIKISNLKGKTNERL